MALIAMAEKAKNIFILQFLVFATLFANFAPSNISSILCSVFEVEDTLSFFIYRLCCVFFFNRPAVQNSLSVSIFTYWRMRVKKLKITFLPGWDTNPGTLTFNSMRQPLDQSVINKVGEIYYQLKPRIPNSSLAQLNPQNISMELEFYHNETNVELAYQHFSSVN